MNAPDLGPSAWLRSSAISSQSKDGLNRPSVWVEDSHRLNVLRPKEVDCDLSSSFSNLPVVPLRAFCLFPFCARGRNCISPSSRATGTDSRVQTPKPKAAAAFSFPLLACSSMCVMQMIAQIRSVSLALAPDVSPSWAAVEVEEDEGGGGHRGVKWAKGKEGRGNKLAVACMRIHTHIREQGFPLISGRLRDSLEVVT